MSSFEKNFSTVINLMHSSDIRPSMVEREYILKRLKSLDKKFSESIKKNPRKTFTYGDKYFAPIGEYHYICIPKNCKHIDDVLLFISGDKNLYEEIILDYSKMQSKFNGEFSIVQLC